jgi:hypothetical protein
LPNGAVGTAGTLARQLDRVIREDEHLRREPRRMATPLCMILVMLLIAMVLRLSCGCSTRWRTGGRRLRLRGTTVSSEALAYDLELIIPREPRLLGLRFRAIGVYGYREREFLVEVNVVWLVVR